VKLGQGRVYFSYWCKLNDIYTCVINTCDILKVPNALVLYIQYATQYGDTIFNLIVSHLALELPSETRY
jgi:hypothetical protein